MTRRDQAIVLRWLPRTNTSRLVFWLSRHGGRQVTLLRGSQRPRSFLLGQFDLFYTCDLVYYTRDYDHLHAMRECSPISRRDGLRADWRAAAVASWCAELVFRALPPDAPQPAVFDLLTLMLDQLAEQGAPRLFHSWFELRLLDLLGLRPRLDECAVCSGALTGSPGGIAFHAAEGGLLCAACAARRSSPALTVGPATLALLAAWQRETTPTLVRRTRHTPRQTAEADELLRRFLEHHLDIPLAGRYALRDILDYPSARAG